MMRDWKILINGSVKYALTIIESILIMLLPISAKTARRAMKVSEQCSINIKKFTLPKNNQMN